jgi:hypothetical protein
MLRDRISVVGVYVLAPAKELRQRLQTRHAELLRFEQSVHFDPATKDSDFEALRQLLP